MKPNPTLVRQFLAKNPTILTAPKPPPPATPDDMILDRGRATREAWRRQRRAYWAAVKRQSYIRIRDRKHAARRAVGTPMTREGVLAWNGRHPVGTVLPNGMVTRSRAWLSHLGLAVVRVEGQQKAIDVPKETL